MFGLGMNLQHIAQMKARNLLESVRKDEKQIIKYSDVILDIGDLKAFKAQWIYLLFAYDGQQTDMIGCTRKEDIDEYAEHFKIFSNGEDHKTLLKCFPLDPLNLPYEINIGKNYKIWLLCQDWYIEAWDTIKQVTNVIESMVQDNSTAIIDDFAILFGCEENYPIKEE